MIIKTIRNCSLTPASQYARYFAQNQNTTNDNEIQDSFTCVAF
jgi:hypothetical protein